MKRSGPSGLPLGHGEEARHDQRRKELEIVGIQPQPEDDGHDHVVEHAAQHHAAQPQGEDAVLAEDAVADHLADDDGRQADDDGALRGVTEPERKRKIIGEEFIRVFEAEARKIGHVHALVQGTIYPDVIESGQGDAAVIKSHHNVGGLPDVIDFDEIIEPLRELFKDEVRAVGMELGIPQEMVWRQPFPGPGLAIRVIGEITREKLDVLRDADEIFRQEVAAAGLENAPGQYFAVLTDTRSVGVMGDGRTYGYTLALRAVTTDDFMTADWTRLPYELLAKASGRITGECKNINRVVYDITSKPPATVEWE